MIVSHLSFRISTVFIVVFRRRVSQRTQQRSREKSFTILCQLLRLVKNCLMAFYRTVAWVRGISAPEGKLMVRNYRHSQTTLNHRLMGIINCWRMAFHRNQPPVQNEVSAVRTENPTVAECQRVPFVCALIGRASCFVYDARGAGVQCDLGEATVAHNSTRYHRRTRKVKKSSPLI